MFTLILLLEYYRYIYKRKELECKRNLSANGTEGKVFNSNNTLSSILEKKKQNVSTLRFVIKTIKFCR